MINKQTYFGFVFLIVLLFVVIACAQRNDEQFRVIEQELEGNRRLWQQSKIVDYEFVCTWYQGGVYHWVPFLIEVKNGVTVSMKPIREKKELEKTEEYENFDTVEKMFESIKAAAANGDKVTVEYHKQYGYPEKIRVMPKSGATDSNYVIEISNFKIMN